MAKNGLLLCLLLALSGTFVIGQTIEKLPCGTIGGRSPWLIKYQSNSKAFEKNLDTDLYVPLTIHILGNDQDVRFFPISDVMDALCTLSEDFDSTQIHFFFEGDINYINETDWNDHGSVLEGAEMMFANNVDHTINCYIVSNPAGNAGYNLPYAGVAVGKNFLDPFTHTWAHEIGHNLSLPHPFIGWEGGVNYNGTTPHSYSDPAPTEVYYDYTYFQDTLILDTLIIDTAIVELVDGSNCAIAADGFCDTPPDYLGFRWACDENGFSWSEQTDPTGAKFLSDGSTFMSYSFDGCQSRFTAEQIAAMRAIC